SARRFSTPTGQIPTDPAGQAIQHRAPGGHPLAGAGRAAGAAIRGGGAAIRGDGGAAMRGGGGAAMRGGGGAAMRGGGGAATRRGGGADTCGGGGGGGVNRLISCLVGGVGGAACLASGLECGDRDGGGVIGLTPGFASVVGCEAPFLSCEAFSCS